MEQLTPINYRIELTPDLQRFLFAGQVDILMASEADVDHIILNASKLAVWRCRMQANEEWVECPFLMDPKTETVCISLPERMQGRIQIRVSYEGKINDTLGGLYRSGYTRDGQEKYMAVTQFQESHARSVFPCFDHPGKKATFDVTLVVDERLTVISNGDVAQTTRLPRGQVRVRFGRTPKMSTYLLFIGMGEFDFLGHETDSRVRAVTTPGQIDKATFGLEFGRKALGFCEDYFRIPYPLTKMDLIAVPDFAFGAMENWGAITFRENLLLYDPDTTSRAGVTRICEVIAHEIVHQWFGNLVSPSDWKYLWLNESFATYFAFSVVDHYYPQWHTWEEFVYSQTATAMDRDALWETLPIELPGGEHVIINTATAPIIYNKGGSVLRQVKGYLGEENYRQGLFGYLDGHAYDGATSRDLWEAFESASQKPVTALMKSWIEQPGFPLIEVRRSGRELILSQTRFTYLPGEGPSRAAGEPGNAPAWLVPVSVQVFDEAGASRQVDTLMDTAETHIDIGSDAAAFKVNVGQSGFYRVRYTDADALTRLGGHVQCQSLDIFDRWGLQDDLFALVRRGNVCMADYLDFLSNYQNEDAFLPIMSIADHLYFSSRVLPEAARGEVAAFARPFLENILARIGYEPSVDESHTTGILRDNLLYKAVFFGADTVRSFALEKFAVLSGGGTIHPDIMKSVCQVAAMVDAAPAFDWLTRQLALTDSEHVRMNLLAAIGCLGSESVIYQGLEYALDTVPSRNKHIPIVSFAQNPAAAGLMWPWYVAHLDALEAFHPIIYERVLSVIVSNCGIGGDADVAAFFRTHTDRSVASADVIKMSLEKRAVNARMRAAYE